MTDTDRKIKIEQTADGSHTLFVPFLDEHYHSVNGAIQESKHVFIDAGFSQIKKDRINILEIGFGTGLNALLTSLEAGLSAAHINYVALELYPLPEDVISKLNYSNIMTSLEETCLFEDLHKAEWERQIEITPYFSLTKHQSDFSKLDISFNEKFDLIYFDAFAPDKQPEMWTQNIFDFLYTYINKEGILTTYCAKGVVRRMMQQSGFKVERIPGPPGKREMLRAIK